MRWLLIHLAIGTAMTLLIALAVETLRPPPVPLPSTLTIERIQPVLSLLTSRVQVSDVAYEKLDGYTGSLKLAALIHGDVLIQIDLADAQLVEIHDDRRTATLVLPMPEAISPRIDHNRTRVIAVYTSGLWRMVPTDQGRAQLFDRAMANAQQRIAQAAVEQTLVDDARQQAERIITTFARDQLDWQIDIRWQTPDNS